MVKALDHDSLVAKHEKVLKVVTDGYNEVRDVTHLLQDFCKFFPVPEKPISFKEYRKLVDGSDSDITEKSLFYKWFLEISSAGPEILPTDFGIDVSHVRSEEFPLEMSRTGHDSNHTFYFKNSDDINAYHQAEEEFDDSLFEEIEKDIYKDCFGDMITHDDL